MIDWLSELIPGLWVSIKLTAASLAVGLPAGIGLALMVMSPLRPLRWLALFLVEAGRGTPALVVLYLVYFGLPSTGLSLNAFLSATIALAFATGAYTSEIFRAGIAGVPHGQIEAGTALAMTRWMQLRRVILPQAIRNVIPPLIGWCIILFQGTSLAYAISVRELMARAYNIGTVTFRFWDVILLAGALYAIICIPLAQLVSRMEAKNR